MFYEIPGRRLRSIAWLGFGAVIVSGRSRPNPLVCLQSTSVLSTGTTLIWAPVATDDEVIMALITSPTKKVLFASLRIILCISLMITALIVATPLYPIMPSSGLDSSWMYAINEAVADSFAFGREVIFTFGPYGAIYTRMFHPGTDALVMGAGLFFGLCFGAVSILLARSSLWWGLCMLFVVASQNYVRDDVVFASYGLLLVMAVSNETWVMRLARRNFSQFKSALFVALLLALGLLPLIKGSLIINVAASSIAVFLLFLMTESIFLAVTSIMAPIIALMVFWTLSGQSIGDLPSYFSNMLQIISGYTEAMENPGDFREAVVYVAASAGLLYVLLKTSAKPAFKLLLLISFVTFLFSAFKGGFVRHDSDHVLFAAAAIILAPVVINMSVFKPRKAFSIVWLPVVAWFLIIDGVYGHSISGHSIPNVLFINLLETYTRGLEGFRERVLTVDLNQAFSDHVTAIAQQANFPKLDGTTDIYDWGQAYLLASGNSWRPRPVLQSYSAYTPHLAQLDQEHLAGGKAPDNILFRLETIDDRFPSMNDGPSWPVLLAKYTLSDERNDYLLLKRLGEAAEPQLQEVLSRRLELGRAVDVPDNNLLFLYAQVEVRPSLLGRIASILYKTNRLRMSVTLASGQTRDFRIVSGMASAGFLLSPLVENTEEFAYLFDDPSALREKEVRSIRIDGDSRLWDRDIQVRLSAIRLAGEKRQESSLLK
jgi:hypothetical protein